MPDRHDVNETPPEGLAEQVNVAADAEWKRYHGPHDATMPMLVGGERDHNQGVLHTIVSEVEFRPVTLGVRTYEVAVNPHNAVVYWRERGVVTEIEDGY